MVILETLCFALALALFVYVTAAVNFAEKPRSILWRTVLAGSPWFALALGFIVGGWGWPLMAFAALIFILMIVLGLCARREENRQDVIDEADEEILPDLETDETSDETVSEELGAEGAGPTPPATDVE